MKEDYFEITNSISAYQEQIVSLLDLIQCSGESVDMKSVRTAAEMVVNLFDDMMDEVDKLKEKYKVLGENK